MSQTQTATVGGDSFAALFEESLKKSDMRAGEVISAEVVRIDYNYVVVNAGLKSEDIGWYELNEAFAAQSLAVVNTLGLDPAKVNPMGGAIALGHPLGATGAIRAATVVHALRRHNLKYGMVTMCVGTGQGAAGIFERI